MSLVGVGIRVCISAPGITGDKQMRGRGQGRCYPDSQPGPQDQRQRSPTLSPNGQSGGSCKQERRQGGPAVPSCPSPPQWTPECFCPPPSLVSRCHDDPHRLAELVHGKSPCTHSGVRGLRPCPLFHFLGVCMIGGRRVITSPILPHIFALAAIREGGREFPSSPTVKPRA